MKTTEPPWFEEVPSPPNWPGIYRSPWGFSIAFVVGFGAAKLPAMRLQTSAFFFQLLGDMGSFLGFTEQLGEPHVKSCPKLEKRDTKTIQNLPNMIFSPKDSWLCFFWMEEMLHHLGCTQACKSWDTDGFLVPDTWIFPDIFHQTAPGVDFQVMLRFEFDFTPNHFRNMCILGKLRYRLTILYFGRTWCWKNPTDGKKTAGLSALSRNLGSLWHVWFMLFRLRMTCCWKNWQKNSVGMNLYSPASFSPVFFVGRGNHLIGITKLLHWKTSFDY